MKRDDSVTPALGPFRYCAFSVVEGSRSYSCLREPVNGPYCEQHARDLASGDSQMAVAEIKAQFPGATVH